MGRKLNLQWVLSSQCCNLKLKSRWRMMENNEKSPPRYHNSCALETMDNPNWNWDPMTFMAPIRNCHRTGTLQWLCLKTRRPISIPSMFRRRRFSVSWKDLGCKRFQVVFNEGLEALWENTGGCWRNNKNPGFSYMRVSPPCTHALHVFGGVWNASVGTICEPCNAPVRTHIDYRHHQ